MAEKQPHNIILLGGHDLEMNAIKQMLEARDDCIIIDKQLHWDNAYLSTYLDELSKYEGLDIYGIELNENINPLPDNYHRIDHHNDKYHLKSSLEQIAEVFGIELSQEQVLIAANDKGYIPAMKAMGATDDDIMDIRQRDRKAQGVTDEDEHLAEQSIQENLTHYENIIIVKSLTNKFSPICDNLYPYEKLLIYNDSAWTYYGIGKNQLVYLFDEDIKQGKIYHGGGNEGYIGAKEGMFSSDEIQKLIETKIKTMGIFSYHNFMFPFQWYIKENKEKTFSQQIDLNNIDYVLGSNWARTAKQTEESDKDDLYNEKNYFFKFVHDALYDNGETNSLIRHFERIEPKHGEVKYIINTQNKSYELKVKYINLNIYSTGVGTLSFYLYNDKYTDKSDIKNINQLGRRIFPPFIDDVNKRSQIPNSIEILGLHGNATRYKEDFNHYTNETKNNTPASFIADIIHEVARNIEIEPVVDDRMFVQCWYKNDEWANVFTNNYDNFLKKEDWYEFVFVDSPNAMTCQNKEMQENIIKKATYARWQKWSSLYGISRYSMVYATNSTCPPFLLNYFETLYARMAELVIVQKASVLRFSAEVTNISNMDSQKDFSKKVSSLYKEYIRFVNQIHFREVSAQDQGIELYKLFYKTMDIEKQVEKLDDEIEELYNYVTLQEDRKSNNTMSLLTWIATILLPITVMAGIFGMNNVAFNGDNAGELKEWWNSFWGQFITIGIITVLIIIIILLVKRKKNG